MAAMIGSPSGEQQAVSRLSAEDAGLITTALHAMGHDPETINRLSAALAHAAHRPAEDIVPDWEPEPPLASDQTFTFGAGAETVTVHLPILGGDYYWSILLPRLQEWVSALYRGQALTLLAQASVSPLPFILDVVGQLIKRPGADRLKISFYETAAATFSRPETPITARFFAKCPPDQQLASIRKLVAINQANFTNLWAEMPTTLRYLIISMRTASMLSIEQLSEKVSSYIYATMKESSDTLHLNGGAPDTGSAGSGASPEEKPTLTSPFAP